MVPDDPHLCTELPGRNPAAQPEAQNLDRLHVRHIAQHRFRPAYPRHDTASRRAGSTRSSHVVEGFPISRGVKDVSCSPARLQSVTRLFGSGRYGPNVATHTAHGVGSRYQVRYRW